MSQTDPPIISTNTDVPKLAKEASVSLVGRMTGRVIQVLGQITLARLLGTRNFGLYTIGWTILRIAGLIAVLGLDKGVVRYASRYWRTEVSKLKGILRQSLVLPLFAGMFIGSVVCLSAPWLAEQVFRKPDLASVIYWFALAFPLSAGLKVAAAATLVSQRTKFSVYSEDMGQPAANLILVLIFYLLGWKLRGALVANIASFSIALVLAIYYVRRIFPETFSPKIKSTFVAKELMAFSLPASFAGMCYMFILWADRLLVGYFRSEADLGIYQAASQSSLPFAVIVSGFNTIFSAMIPGLYQKKEMPQLNELFKVSTKWRFYLSIPLFLGICFASREFITVVFGISYEDGWLPLIILSAGHLVNAGVGGVGVLLVMTGHQNRWLVLSGAMLSMNILLNIVLIPNFGLAGAAFVTAGTRGGLLLLGLFQVRNLLQIWPYDRRFLKGLLAVVPTVGALLLIRAIPIDSPPLILLSVAIVSGGVFTGSLLLLGLEEEDWVFIRMIQTRLR